MNGEEYITQIEESMPDENPDDIVMMINILAHEKYLASGKELNSTLYEFAAGILCLLFKVVKTPDYTSNMQALRNYFNGISEERDLRLEFRDSMTNNLLDAESVEYAINLGVENLFNIEGISGDDVFKKNEVVRQ